MRQWRGSGVHSIAVRNYQKFRGGNKNIADLQKYKINMYSHYIYRYFTYQPLLIPLVVLLHAQMHVSLHQNMINVLAQNVAFGLIIITLNTHTYIHNDLQKCICLVTSS